MNPRLVITGTRWGRPDVWDALDAWVDTFGAPAMLVLGGQRGVDTQAAEWALAYAYHRKLGHGFPVKTERPKRSSRSRAAELLARNQRMVDWCEPGDHLLAFPHQDSSGTWHCHGLGVKAGLLCTVVDARKPWLRELRIRHGEHPRWAA